MAFVIKASQRNVDAGTGGPFAAAIFNSETDELISLGVNLVTTQGMSILHAEMVAISLAQRKLGSYDLGAEGLPMLELATTTEPCAMCFGAIPWSGVQRVVAGARDEDARHIGFDEGPKLKDWVAALRERNIAVSVDVKRDEAKSVLENYLKASGRIYNSRES
jgi:tRNA(Arg) A34 adenosine deaminase TadA